MIAFAIPGVCVAHNAALARFKLNISAQGDCLVWKGKLDRKGYARFKVNGRMVFVHRFAFEAFKGEIPAGLQIDHLCRNRACSNPHHLEAVTCAENIKRGTQGGWQKSKTECPKGHPYDEKNTYLEKNNKRQCRACRHAASLARSPLARLREEARL